MSGKPAETRLEHRARDADRAERVVVLARVEDRQQAGGPDPLVADAADRSWLKSHCTCAGPPAFGRVTWKLTSRSVSNEPGAVHGSGGSWPTSQPWMSEASAAVPLARISPLRFAPSSIR
jgi:hypothetical protein